MNLENTTQQNPSTSYENNGRQQTTTDSGGGVERRSDRRKERAIGLKQSIVRSMMHTLAVEMMIINAMTRHRPPEVRRQMLAELEKVWKNYGQRINFMRRIGSTNAAVFLPDSVIVQQVR